MSPSVAIPLCRSWESNLYKQLHVRHCPIHGSVNRIPVIAMSRSPQPIDYQRGRIIAHSRLHRLSPYRLNVGNKQPFCFTATCATCIIITASRPTTKPFPEVYKYSIGTFGWRLEAVSQTIHLTLYGLGVDGHVDRILAVSSSIITKPVDVFMKLYKNTVVLLNADRILVR